MPALRRFAALLVALACAPAPPKVAEKPPAPAQKPASVQEPAPPVAPPPTPEPAPAPDANEAILDHLFGPRPAGAPTDALTGIFSIDRVARYSGGDPFYQPSTLHFEDGTHVFLAHHPLPGYFAFVDRRVVVTGWPAGSLYFRAATMNLAPGELAREGAIDSLPPPPRARTRAEVERQFERWVLAVGTVDDIVHTGKGDGDLVLRLADRSRVVGGGSYESLSKYGGGERVTVLGSVWRRDGQLRLHSIRVCKGEVDRCDGGR